MKTSTAASSNAETRDRLLEAGGEVFAERGYRNATVREICARARANVAAVNYHFGDKERLYEAVLRFADRCSLEKYPLDLGLRRDATPEDRLRAFVRSFLLRIFDEGQPAWHGKLMSREMIEPTAALDRIVDEVIRPRFEQLQSIVRDLAPPGRLSAEQVRTCASSIVGQCLHYHHAQAVIARLQPRLEYRPKEIERLAEHVTAFSLGGIERLARGGRR
ncbi:MAG: CerR family C-terminal domain-containing protein [Planctomycetes bacterium]|nr:CerR family C-terminal domain-containing protein [Planctomycetota bacterium]